MNNERQSSNPLIVQEFIDELEEHKKNNQRPPEEFIDKSIDTIHEILEHTTREELIEILDLFVATLSPNEKK